MSNIRGKMSRFNLRFLPPSGVRIRFLDILAGLSRIFYRRVNEEFRDDICRYFGVSHCFFTSSGRAGLSMLFQALHRMYPDRNEVILPAFTSFSVPSAVVNAGLKAALYDLDSETSR